MKNQHICTVVLLGLERDLDCVCESVLSGMFELSFLFVRRSQSDMALMRFLVCELHPQTTWLHRL